MSILLILMSMIIVRSKFHWIAHFANCTHCEFSKLWFFLKYETQVWFGNIIFDRFLRVYYWLTKQILSSKCIFTAKFPMPFAECPMTFVECLRTFTECPMTVAWCHIQWDLECTIMIFIMTMIRENDAVHYSSYSI